MAYVSIESKGKVRGRDSKYWKQIDIDAEAVGWGVRTLDSQVTGTILVSIISVAESRHMFAIGALHRLLLFNQR